MKKNLTSLLVLSLLSVCTFTSCTNNINSGDDVSTDTNEWGTSISNTSYTGKKTEIKIDGGGDIGDYNSTPSMIQTDANPYPYNTLETLCAEWVKTHPQYTISINRTSSGGDRSILVPQLKNGTACDIVYQNGSVVNSDLGQGYYVDLTPYLDAEDPYLENNAKWSSVYNEQELATTQAADGKYYYVNLEKIPVCFMYNKDLLAKAGVSNPENITTFGQLIAAMDKVETYSKAQGKQNIIEPYSTTYTWYQIAMESNLFSDLLEEGDVLRTNGVIDTEELARLYTKGLYQPGLNASSASDTFADNRFYEYITLIEKLDQYKAIASYDCNANWINGNLAFMEATGEELRNFNSNSNINFEWGTIPFPDITTDDSASAQKPCVRGSAGLATSWWITKRAVNNNTVEGCVDLLMYLTAPEQNNRLVGDLKGGIPLNPSDDYELSDYLKPLVNQYNDDLEELNEGKRVNFSAFNSWAVLGVSYSNSFIRTMQDLDSGATNAKTACSSLAKTIDLTVKSYIVEYEYDTTKW